MSSSLCLILKGGSGCNNGLIWLTGTALCFCDVKISPCLRGNTADQLCLACLSACSCNVLIGACVIGSSWC